MARPAPSSQTSQAPRSRLLFIACAAGLILLFLFYFTCSIHVRDVHPRLPSPKQVVTRVAIKIQSPRPQAKPASAKLQAAPAPAPPVPARGHRAPGKDEEGPLPPFQLDYRTHLGFRRYAEAMERLGAVFIIPHVSEGNRFLQIDFPSHSFIPISLAHLKRLSLSPRVRILKDEPALVPYLRLAREQYKIPNPQVMLLVPLSVEERLRHALTTRVCPRYNLRLSRITAIKGRYISSGGKLAIQLSAIHTPDQVYPANQIIPF